MNAEIKNMTEEQIADLETQIKEWREEKEYKSLAWKPKHGGEYWLIDVKGGACSCDCYMGILDNQTFAIGNVFRTQELAKAEVKRRQIKRQIEELVDKYDSERGGAFVVGKYNYTFSYAVITGTIIIDKWSSLLCPLMPYFSSHEVAKQILNEIGAENIKLLFTEYPIVRGE